MRKNKALNVDLCGYTFINGYCYCLYRRIVGNNVKCYLAPSNVKVTKDFEISKDLFLIMYNGIYDSKHE